MGFDANGDLVFPVINGTGPTSFFTTINPETGGPGAGLSAAAFTGSPPIPPNVVSSFPTSCQPILGLDQNGNLIANTVMTTGNGGIVVIENDHVVETGQVLLRAAQGNPGSGAECLYWSVGNYANPFVGGLAVNGWGQDDGEFIVLPSPTASGIIEPIWSVGADAFLVIWYDSATGVYSAAGFSVVGERA